MTKLARAENLKEYIKAAEGLDPTDGGIFTKADYILQIVKAPTPYKHRHIVLAFIAIHRAGNPESEATTLWSKQGCLLCPGTKGSDAPGSGEAHIQKHIQHFRAFLSARGS